MPQDNREKKLRILFGHPDSTELTRLSGDLASAGEFNCEQYVASPDEIWKKAISTSADVVLLFFPGFDTAEERCVRRILRGAFSHILLLTYRPVDLSFFPDRGNRLDSYLITGSKTDFGDVFSRICQMGNAKRSTEQASRKLQKPAAAAEAVQSQLSDAALSSKIVAVGASTGGPDALSIFFQCLNPRMPGIVVVQHMPPGFTAMFAQRLDRELPFTVVEASDGVLIKPGSIHIAPGDRHLRIKKVGGSYYTVVGGAEKVNGHCPSVNVLFESVADAAGSSASGVILTGMGGDGAEGLLKMRQRGAFTVGQDQASCVVYGMPRKAFEIGALSAQAELDKIAAVLTKNLGK